MTKRKLGISLGPRTLGVWGGGSNVRPSIGLTLVNTMFSTRKDLVIVIRVMGKTLTQLLGI